MTSYRLMDGADGRPGDGPSEVTSYSGDFIAGLCVSVTGGVRWLEGYWWWVCPAGQSTAPQKFALWNHYGAGLNALVSGSVVTSGTLGAGQWNYVPLSSPIPLAPGTQYVPSTGFVTSTDGGTGFPATNDQFGSGQPYAGGIVNGPLTAWSDSTSGGTNNYPGSYSMDQGLFSAAGSDPSAAPPVNGSNSANFWIDLQVADTPPGGYEGPWQIYPAMLDAEGFEADLGHNYTLGTEITLSQACTLSAIRYYSGSGCTQLATDAALWDVATQEIVAGTHLPAPSWSGAAGSGWIQADYDSPPVIPAGDYKIAIFNSAESPEPFNVTTVGYFTTGFGAAGLTSGPITCPDATSATSPGQGTYQDTTGSPSFVYPDEYVAEGQNYWLDAIVTPVAASALLMAAGII